MPVYGNMLNSFPELMKTYEVFKMQPLSVGGYGERYDVRKVKGYWSWRKQSRLMEQGGVLALNYQATFWAKDDRLTRKPNVALNDFVSVGGEIFRVIDEQNFSYEGGFVKCLMQKLAGTTDQQVTNTKVDEVVLSDY